MSVHRWLMGATTTVILAACGSATDATTFAAPPGYTTAVSVGPFAQVWRGANTRSAIILMALPGEIDYKDITSESNVKDAEIIKQQPVKICGNQDAHYYSMIGDVEVESRESPPPGEARKQQIDVIATHLNGKTYLAMYTRPEGTTEDTAAEGAIHEICPKV
jgi:hypothetical protein